MAAFKMKNPTEQLVLNEFKRKYPDITILRGSDIPNVQWVVENIPNERILILNVQNTELPKTELDNYKTIEFCYINNGVVTWIDSQYLRKPSSLNAILLDKIYDTKHCADSYIFVIEGDGYTETVYKKYNMQIKGLEYLVEKKEKVKVLRMESLFNQI